ncbi:MAG: alpha/beta fold hydrolase [Gammaproteobacteria bacterium]|nr:alpha/beta fold hydrolase [Gammaproteobacteria bacterium]
MRGGKARRRPGTTTTTAPRVLVALARSYADIAPLHHLKYISYTASDGKMIPAYLGVPEGEGPWPTVLLPHGGPYARDTDAFDPWAELLLDRGYAVLKPNFRGSAGYGDAFMAAGFEQWGARMQQDVMDGLDWMIEQGIADPARSCVVGGSYGGYVALTAAFQAPERIRCAAAFAPVTDLKELATRERDFMFGRMNSARVQSDPAAQRSHSPLHQIDRIGVPILLMHGKLDRNVMFEQSKDFAKAMTRADKPGEFVIQETGDHFLSRTSHRIQWFEALDQFLADHLGGTPRRSNALIHGCAGFALK